MLDLGYCVMSGICAHWSSHSMSYAAHALVLLANMSMPRALSRVCDAAES